MSDETGAEGELHGRRSILKKAAVAGAVTWTAPTVLSMTAGAQDSPDCEGTCTAVVIGNTALYDSGDIWYVPLSLSAACPNCFQLVQVGNNQLPSGDYSVNDLGNDNVAVRVNSTRLRIAVGDCSENVAVNVSFPVIIRCNGTQSTCCARVSFTMTKSPAGNLCTEYTIGSFSATVGSGAC